MRIYGNLMNRVMEHSKNVTPEVGMGVTIYHWSDRNAGTITRVSPSGKTLWFKEDLATRTDTNGMSESQSYTFKPNPNAREEKATLRKNGVWRTSPGGEGMRLGFRDAYHDFSF